TNCDLTEKGTESALEELFKNKRKPTAIVTFNDYVALYAIKHSGKLGLEINKDIEFVSYSNLPLFNYMEHAPLASVEQFPYKQGATAAEILLNLIHNLETGNTQEEGYYRLYIESQLIEKDQ